MEELLRLLRRCAGKDTVYIVGGWVRDRQLKRKNRDLDLAVEKNPLSLARKTARALKGRLVILDESNRIYRVVLKEHPLFDYIDFARFRGKDIAADLKARDFTVNAMALPLAADAARAKPLDPCGGKADSARRRVRMTSEKAFTEDPLRLLRAFRLAAELGFAIEPATARAIRRHAALITRSAAERIRDEFFRILACDNASRYILLMDKAGIMEAIIPEIAQMKKSARRFYYHPNGLWQHALETLMSLELILGRLDRFFPGGRADEVRRHLDAPLAPGITRRSLLKLIALIHDMGKPASAQRVGNRMRFLGHEEKGAAMAGELFRQLRVGRKEVRIGQHIIEHHMRPISLAQAKKVTPRAALRLFRDIGEEVPDLLLLSLSDCYSYRRLKTKLTLNLRDQECTARHLIDYYYGEKAKPAAPRLIDGTVLMRHLKLAPGPIIGALLKIVNEAQQLGTVTTADEALALAKKRLTPLAKRYKIT